MSGFFPVSKAFEFLAAPSHILLWLVIGAAAALLLGQLHAARVLSVLAAALFVLIGVAPLSSAPDAAAGGPLSAPAPAGQDHPGS